MESLFSGAALWFSIPALFGTFVFLLRVVFMLVGGDGDLDADLDADFDVDAADHTTSAFKLLSLQTVSAFSMGFGWGGLGGLLGAGWDPISSFAFGAVTGTGMVWLLTKLLRAVMQLQSSGTVETSHALGLEGGVYTAIPGHRGGRGSVKVVIDDRLRYLKAVTDGESIPSQARVRATDPVLMNAAAERLLYLNEAKIQEQAQDIILGQLRLVIATLSIEEINKDREKFMSLINENVTEEINKIGLTLINVNIRDITARADTSRPSGSALRGGNQPCEGRGCATRPGWCDRTSDCRP